MRNLSEVELLSLTGLLKMEQDSLTLSRALTTLIKNDELKKTAETSNMAMEARIKGMHQFILENQVANVREVQ